MTTSRYKRRPDGGIAPSAGTRGWLAPRRGAGGAQRGLVILVITVSLLVTASLATLMVARVGLFEQKFSGVDMRDKEVYAAAMGGLEHGLSWLRENVTTLDFRGGRADGLGGADTAPGYRTQLTADGYDHHITYTLKTPANPDKAAMPAIVEVRSRAVALNDSQVRKSVATDVMIGRVINPFAGTPAEGPLIFTGPALMIEGCVTGGGRGNPALYPGMGHAMGTTSGIAGAGPTAQAIEGCLASGVVRQCAEGVAAHQCPLLAPTAKVALDPRADNLWSAIFAEGFTPQHLRLLSQDETASAVVLHVDGGYPHTAGQPGWSGGDWHASAGTPERPVILYFDASAGCPAIAAGVTVHGLVYYPPGCGEKGVIRGSVHGTVAIAGNLLDLGESARIFGRTLDFSHLGGLGGGTRIHPGLSKDLIRFAAIPGSWRDF
ncbi:MAG: hypothetical protein WC247_13580 [Porticoccaceae bacterium]